MNPQAGLSFEQAPPFSLPLRFFLTAPLFLLIASLVLVFVPESLGSRHTPQALALTHAVTLGFLAMVMLGALTQMLPVVAGSPLPAPVQVTRLVHVSLTLGTFALLAGFMHGLGVAFGIAVVLLGGGLTVFLVAASISLARAPTNVTVTGIRLAVACLGFTLLLGGALALLRAGWWSPPGLAAAINAHIGFGLLGWVLLLVVGVAYQVVPMFQITPPYPPLLSRWLAGAMFALLLLHALSPLLTPTAEFAVDALLASGILLFAIATLRLQSKRRRKLPDLTLDFWRVGMASLILCVAVWLGARVWPTWADSHAYPVLLGALFLGGFAVSVVNGMLYKIVPFLAWFHLQAQLQARSLSGLSDRSEPSGRARTDRPIFEAHSEPMQRENGSIWTALPTGAVDRPQVRQAPTAGSIPNMKQMIDERRMRMQFRLHLAGCALLALACVFPGWLAVAAGAAMAISTLLLWLNLISATRRFLGHGGRPG